MGQLGVVRAFNWVLLFRSWKASWGVCLLASREGGLVMEEMILAADFTLAGGWWVVHFPLAEGSSSCFAELLALK